MGKGENHLLSWIFHPDYCFFKCHFPGDQSCQVVWGLDAMMAITWLFSGMG